MDAVVGPFYVVAALLLVSGVAKMADPSSTEGALRSVGLPAPRSTGRVIGVAEIVIGILAVVVGGSAMALLVAAAYLSFAGFIVLALSRKGAVSSCGCLGSADTPPTWAHLVLNVAATAIAAIAAISAPPGMATAIAEQPAAGTIFIAFVVLGAWFGYLVLAALPRLIPGETS